jgi:chorismate-pyruvate lyase
MESLAPSDLLQPLGNLYRPAGLSLPATEVLDGASIPEPYRTLLVHTRDMTRTLESHHSGTIHLRLLSTSLDGNRYRRTVALQLDGSGRPVEFGATEAFLDRIPEPWREQIVEGRRPLGGILNASGIPYLSRPSAYFRTRGDAIIRSALGIGDETWLFGRRNTLSDAEGHPLAEIVEILPP